ncbi:SMP-30/gluconolactonase/LRE family protein [Bacillus sp. Marseille-P3661]|uniref:SMP-30/gluconolactonase/LRE family protein n=1 Tax=Bacillus sp. Marseille-P3661 TaxID=1936234 RepID=UPI001C63E90C|nr:SMP-30/gluconolactonase/LRE family protein [Bacillus sp. Marseille-P3661]
MSQIKLDIYDEKFLNIFDPNEQIEVIESGFDFIEGPVWHPKEEHLTFSDIPASKIYRWSSKKGLTVLVDPTNKANGNYYDLEGRLVTCEHSTSLVSRRNVDGTNREVLVSKYNGKELNCPNDIVVKSDGSIYFTDPQFARTGPNAAKVGIPREKELDFQGVYRFDPKSGELTLLVSDFENPNGLCFSLDERLLYINDTPRMHIRVFDVLDDGTIANGRVWAETTGEEPGRPDGMKVDSLGNVYCTGPGGVHVFDKDANCLGVLKTPEKTANFTWGGSDFCSLFLASGTTLYRTQVKIPGMKHKIM